MSNFPSSLDNSSTLPNPSASNNTNSPSHAGLHATVNAAIIAAQTKLGIGATTPVNNTLLFGTGAGTSAWTALTSAQLASVLTDETGSGSAVFANTPTLITPKVDTINEATNNNGVTVDGVNLKDGIVNGSGAGLTSGTVPGASLVNDSVGATKLNFAATGADAGIWWEELGRVTLASNNTTLSLTSLPARKYLHIIFYGIATGGTVSTLMRFNNDSGTNYHLRLSDNGAAQGTFPSQNGITLDAGSGLNIYADINLINVATQEKQITFHSQLQGSGTSTGSREGFPKWGNTSDLISRIDVITTANNYGSGSELIVLGHN